MKLHIPPVLSVAGTEVIRHDHNADLQAVLFTTALVDPLYLMVPLAVARLVLLKDRIDDPRDRIEFRATGRLAAA